MIRYSTLSPFFDAKKGNTFDYVSCDNKDFSESKVDDSYYVPERALIKSLNGNLAYQKAMGEAMKPFYDFPDGKDTDKSTDYVLGRKPGIDIAEVQYSMQKTQESLKENLKKDSANAKKLKDAQDAATKAKNKPVEATPAPSPTPTTNPVK